MLKPFIKKLIPQPLLERYKIFNGSRSFFSQFGEDILLSNLFGGDKKSGVYVDVGAYHPIELSNTYFFYRRGWRGINIEPTPHNYQLLLKQRAEDININSSVSLSENPVHFYIFSEHAINTISKDKSEESSKLGYNVQSTIQVQSAPLEKILDNYLPKNAHIDFLSVDVEGMDLEVLISNNWDKYSPSVVLVEDLSFNFSKVNENKINLFLQGKNYILRSVLGPTLLYIHKDFAKTVEWAKT